MNLELTVGGNFVAVPRSTNGVLLEFGEYVDYSPPPKPDHKNGDA